MSTVDLRSAKQSNATVFSHVTTWPWSRAAKWSTPLWYLGWALAPALLLSVSSAAIACAGNLNQMVRCVADQRYGCLNRMQESERRRVEGCSRVSISKHRQQLEIIAWYLFMGQGYMIYIHSLHIRIHTFISYNSAWGSTLQQLCLCGHSCHST